MLGGWEDNHGQFRGLTYLECITIRLRAKYSSC